VQTAGTILQSQIGGDDDQGSKAAISRTVMSKKLTKLTEKLSQNPGNWTNQKSYTGTALETINDEGTMTHKQHRRSASMVKD
jgi:hypothetical protein